MKSRSFFRPLALSFALISAIPATTCSEVTITPLQIIVAFAKNHPVALGTGIAFAYAGYRRLTTKRKPKKEYHMADLREDFKEFLASLNIFNGKMYRQLMFMFDKYIIGLQVKIENMTTRTKEEDGSVVTLHGKKLVQKPFGVYGLFHAYVLTDMDKFLGYMAPLSVMYVLLTSPIATIEAATKKAGEAPTGK